ncbi:hypothetical protein JL722_9604 [Aureococcus anophagefferens]|nr:hypothetical protein JL722_9604 [Aureococcus anophagefferens]
MIDDRDVGEGASFAPPLEELTALTPAWRNLFENTATVQFDHRSLAYATSAAVGALAASAAGPFGAALAPRRSSTMKFAVIALAATASALVAPASLRRPATALAVATAEVPVKSFDGADAGTATLSLKTTKGEKDMYVVHRKYVNERRNARQGTASTKTRAEVRGGGRKPFKQKGTGRARQGSTRTPLKPGGGVVFGPKPKDWANKKINRKEAELAIGIAIQNKAARATVVDSLAGKFVGAPKTKSVTSMLSGLASTPTKTVLVDTEDDVRVGGEPAQLRAPPPGRDAVPTLWANQVPSQARLRLGQRRHGA